MGPTFSDTHRSSILDFHFLSHYSYIKAITGLDMLASWVLHWFDWATLMVTWGHLGHYLGTTLASLWHTLAYSGILWHTLAYSCILWHTLAYSGIFWHTLAYSGILWHTLPC